MATANVNPRVNSNAIDLSQYKGKVRPCPMCKPGDELLRGMQACRLCLGRRFVAQCLNCNGTGIYGGRSPWDGGRSEQSSTCDKCGGQGVFAVNRPVDWQEQRTEQAPDTVTAANPNPSSLGAAVKAVLPPPPSMQGGAVLPGGVVVK